MPRIRIETGKQAGKSYDVAKTAIVGRAETAEIQISDNHASREHCKVFEQGGTWIVADLNSRNGIKVNGVQTTRRNLASGDKITIGETTLVFETTAAAPAKSAAPPAARTSKRDEAFAAARVSATAAPAKRQAAPAATAEAASGLQVSDHVLQFNKIDPKTASLLDIDLAQSASGSRLLVWIGCLAFLALVVWLVAKMAG